MRLPFIVTSSPIIFHIFFFKPKNEDGQISLKTLNVKTKLIPSVKSNKWKISGNAHADGGIIQNGANFLK